jgi:hypothetical protein
VQERYSEKKEYKTLPHIPLFFLILLLFLLSLVIAFKVIPLSLVTPAIMEVYKQAGDKILGQESEVGIFDNPRFGGRNLIAPYSEGVYDFSVYNNSPSGLLPYSLILASANPDNVPIVISLQKNGKYIYGGAGVANMLPLDDLLLLNYLLKGKAADLYTLRWVWQTESDPIDTEIGNDGTQLYTLTITATGTKTEVVMPHTCNCLHICIWFVLFILSLLVIAVLIYLLRRKNRHEDNQDISEHN